MHTEFLDLFKQGFGLLPSFLSSRVTTGGSVTTFSGSANIFSFSPSPAFPGPAVVVTVTVARPAVVAAGPLWFSPETSDSARVVHGESKHLPRMEMKCSILELVPGNLNQKLVQTMKMSVWMTTR